MPWLKHSNREKKAAWPKLETDLLVWITEKRNNGLAILPSLVRLKALELAKDEKYKIPEGLFKAGNHWCQQFMKRNSLLLWQKITMAQWLPDDYKEKIIWFHRFIINRHKEHNPLPLPQIWMKGHLHSTCHQITWSTTPARKPSRSTRQETRIIVSQLYWRAVEMVPN